MTRIIYIFILSVLLVSCDSFNEKPAEELIRFLEKHPDINYLETNFDILKVNKTYYCDFIESELQCLNKKEVQDKLGCTKVEIDRAFELVKKSGAFAVEKNEKGQILFAQGGFMNDFEGNLYSPFEINIKAKDCKFTMFYFVNIEKETNNWYKVF